jgi:hypothetical protein
VSSEHLIRKKATTALGMKGMMQQVLQALSALLYIVLKRGKNALPINI